MSWTGGLGNGLVWVAATAAIAAALSQAVRLRTNDESWRRIADRAVMVAAVAAVVAFLWLIVRFLAIDLGIEYVFLYTSTGTSWPYRIAGAWTGREGSLLLWSAYIAIVAAVVAWRDRNRVPFEGEDPARQWTRLILFAVAAWFLTIIARQGTFDPTDPFFLDGRPGGNGMNPTLRSPFMLIHPPMMFVAYALTTVPLAAGLAHMITGTGRWSTIAARAARLDWLVYTIAMGLGGMWAYYTLGFGGYWAWDPVEVANFLPWLAATIYLHAQLRHRRDGGFALGGPLLATLPFLLTVFSTVSTRSGLWVSVHAFTDPTNAFEPDAAARLLGILDVDASLAPYFGIFGGVLLASLALWTRRLAIDLDVVQGAARIIGSVFAAAAVLFALAPIAALGGVFSLAAMITSDRLGLALLGALVVVVLAAALPLLIADDASTGKRTWTSRLLAVSVILLGVGLIIATLFHFATVNGWDQSFWEARVPWIVTPIALAMTWFLALPRGKRRASAIAIGAFALAVIAFGLSPSPLGGYALVLGFAVLTTGFDRTILASCRGPPAARTGSGLLIAAALLNVAFWVSPPRIIPGLFEWVPAWPMQVPFVAASLVGLWAAHRIGLGGPRPTWAYVLVGALGAFYIAPVLAAAAWFVHRKAAPKAVKTGAPKPAAWRMTGVFGVHMVVGLLFVGYAASTYFTDEFQGELSIDETSVGPIELTYLGTEPTPEAGTPWAATLTPRFTVGDPDDSVEATGLLYWEPQTGSHYPLPRTVRSWDGDLYVSIDSVCVGDPCEPGNWTDAYEVGGRIGWNEPIGAVQVQAIELPHLRFVWASLVLFGAYGLPLAWIDDKRRK